MTARSRGRPRHPDVLTPAEWEVLNLVRHGLDRRGIARQRGVGEDAIKYHLANISGKLGVRGIRKLRQWPGMPATSRALIAQDRKESRVPMTDRHEGKDRPGRSDGDRLYAGEDRFYAGEDRLYADDDRSSAGRDRLSAGDDRPSAGDDRPGEGDPDPLGSRAHHRLGPVGQVSLMIRDVGRAERFYGQVLGLRHVFTFGDLAFFDADGLRIYLHRKDEADWRPGSILYFRVDDIERAHRDLGAGGVRFSGAPHRIYVDESTGTEEWMAFFEDEEGNTLALMSRVGGGG